MFDIRRWVLDVFHQGVYAAAMLPPVTERELRTALRRRRAHEQWVAAAWITGAVTGVSLFSFSGAGGSSTGAALFRWLFALQLAIIVGRGLTLTADVFSEERRNGTLGLLVLTGLTPLEIFTSKLLGAILITAYSMVGSLPFLAISFLAGGVPAFQFVSALVALVNALLFCVAVGLLASVASREGGQAQISAVIAVALLCLATPAAVWVNSALRGVPASTDGWLALSPALAPWLTLTSLRSAGPELFWTASGVTLSYTLVALLLAGIILHRTWRDLPQEFTRKRGAGRRRPWLRGSADRRQRLRERLLEAEPFCWLAARNRRQVLAAEIFLGVLAALWLAVFLLPGHARFLIASAVVASVVMHQGLNWLLAYSAAAQVSAERQSGGFEILLTTPLTVENIVAGQQRALTVQFNRILTAATILDGAMLAMVLLGRPWSIVPAILFSIAWLWWMAAWKVAHRVAPLMAMWIGAWTGRPAYAAWLGVRPVMSLMLTLMPIKSPQRLARKLEQELRLIACAPIPARGDPRFRNWNPEEIFPPGRWGELKLREPKRSRSWSRHAKLFAPRRRQKRPQFTHQLREPIE